MSCSAALPTSCRPAARLLAESAVAVKSLDRADLARRIKNATDDAADAKGDEGKAKAEAYLNHLTTLEAAL